MANLPKLLSDLLTKEAGNWQKKSLHPSMDLQGCVRRTCLEWAGADKRSDSTHDLTRRRVGQELHRWFERALERQGFEVETEVKVADGLPEGWRGSADVVLRVEDEDESWLIDLKTVSSIQLHMADLTSSRAQITNKDNSWPSKDYVWQLSAYFHALNRMGKPVDRALLLFWPIDTYYDRSGRKHALEPRQVEITPVPEDELLKRMDEVAAKVETWKTAAEKTGKTTNYDLPDYIEPEQKLIPKPSTKRVEYYELHQKLDWRCRYCPFFRVSCDPPYGDERLGEFHYENGEWVFHPEHPDATPLVRP